MMRTLSVVALVLLATPALAQIGPSVGGPGGAGLGNYGSGLPARHSHDDDDSGAAKKDDKPVAPPAAIPGAQPDPDAVVIPADKIAAEMSPNDALFDAINRGDLAAAKDAVSRGAQLDAHNVLGQTPTDAAIDLSRNDITFMLLSMRGGVSSGRPSRQASAALAPPKTRPAKPQMRPVVARVDRGTPNPSVGFTGF